MSMRQQLGEFSVVKVLPLRSNAVEMREVVSLLMCVVQIGLFVTYRSHAGDLMKIYIK